jgi:hypothetical protein
MISFDPDHFFQRPDPIPGLLRAVLQIFQDNPPMPGVIPSPARFILTHAEGLLFSAFTAISSNWLI